jgi:hypothetical protein
VLAGGLAGLLLLLRDHAGSSGSCCGGCFARLWHWLQQQPALWKAADSPGLLEPAAAPAACLLVDEWLPIESM